MVLPSSFLNMLQEREVHERGLSIYVIRRGGESPGLLVGIIQFHLGTHELGLPMEEKNRFGCSQVCRGLIPKNIENGSQILHSTLIHAFHNFYLEHRGPYLIIFLNARGVILASLGHHDLLKATEELGIIPGASWAEGCQNLFLLSLKEKSPLYSMGPQKECSLFRSFSLMSIPLNPQEGNPSLMGFIGDSSIFLKDLLPKARSFIRKMEQEMKYYSATDLLSGEASLEKTLASLAHEIKNPLMIIRGNAQLGKMLTSVSEKDGKFSKILGEVDSLITTIDDMVAIHRKREIDFTRNDLHGLLEDVTGVFEAELKLKKLTLEKNFSALHFTFDFNYNLLRQAFLNLLSNGIQVLEKGGILSIYTFNPVMDRVMVHLKDTGPGMEEEEISRVFLPFYSTREEGTGLGLAIVKKIIVDNHGGTIKVDSKPGEGTVFSITFSL